MKKDLLLPMTDKVLLVDDDRSILLAYGEMLAQHYDICTARNGKQGLILLEQEGPFAVVISDQMMPEMSGIEFLEEVRQRAPHTSRIMLTGSEEQDTAIEAVNQGAIFRFYTKPCLPDTLRNAVEEGIQKFHERVGLLAENRMLREEYKKAELEVEAAQLAHQQAEEMRQEFLARVNHELRTPLQHIIGYSEMIRGEHVGADRHGEYADHIFGSGNHLLRIVDDLLTLSRTRGGMLSMKTEAVDLADVVDGCIEDLVDQAIAGSVALERNIPDRLPPVSADTYILRKVIGCLLSNAVKFTDPGGTVTVIAQCRQNGQVVLSIIDTGIGMASDDAPAALTDFGQVDGGLDRRRDGMGIGLPLARALCEFVGWALTLQSSPNAGTVATITLPTTQVSDSALAS